MNVQKAIVRRITDALVANAIDTGAALIETEIFDDGDGVTIRVTDNGGGMSEEVRQAALRDLNQERRDEYDHYYGQLAGQGSPGRGLVIVGYMIDRATITCTPNGWTVVEVHRERRDKKRKK